MKNNGYYVVTMNGGYMNSFESYTQAMDLVDILTRKYPRSKIFVTFAENI